MLTKYLLKLKLTRQIKRTTRLLYSDTLSISTEEERIYFINKLTLQKDNFNLILEYLAVKCATKGITFSKPYQPITTEIILDALNEIEIIRKYSSDEKLIALGLDLHGNVALRCLRLASYYFIKGREAYKTDLDSFEGFRYITEKKRRRPLTTTEYDKLKKIINVS